MGDDRGGWAMTDPTDTAQLVMWFSIAAVFIIGGLYIKWIASIND